MKFVSWNVSGLRTCLNKDFLGSFREADVDVFYLQETRMQESQAEPDLPGYLQYWNSTKKEGYSGVAASTRKGPLSVCYDTQHPDHTGESCVIILEFKSFYLVGVYTPSSQRELVCLPYQMKWENALRKYVAQLDGKKLAIICGDLNVVHQEIDLKDAKSNIGNTGFSYEERGKLIEPLVSGLLDSFRELCPDPTGAYA